MEKREIDGFIIPYLTIFEDDERTEIVDCILKKVLFNKQKIEEHKEEIMDFLIDNFMLKGYKANNTEKTTIPDFEFVLPIDLLKRPDGSIWNEFEYQEDMETLERVVGLMKMVDFLDKSPDARAHTLRYISPRRKYLDPTYRDSFDFFKEYKYYQELYDNILPVFCLKVNIDVINKRLQERSNKNNTPEESEIDKKELLTFWWNNYKNVYNDQVNEKFSMMLENNLDEVIGIATFLTLNKMGPMALSMNLLNGENTIALKLSYLLSQVSEEELEAFEKMKENFLMSLEIEYKKKKILKKKR